MREFFNSTIGRLRLLAFLEGTSLLLLLFIAMPFKYLLDMPILVRVIGSIHGFLFLLFVFYTLFASARYKWKFWKITWQLLLASFIPFGTFYVDRKFLQPEQALRGSV